MNNKEWKRKQEEHYKRIDSFIGNLFAGIMGGSFVTLFIEISRQEINWRFLNHLSLFIFVIGLVCFLYFFPGHAWIRFKIKMGEDYRVNVKNMKKVPKKHKKLALSFLSKMTYVLFLIGIILIIVRNYFTPLWIFFFISGLLSLLIRFWLKYFVFEMYGKSMEKIILMFKK